jgi:hypothetical protein
LFLKVIRPEGGEEPERLFDFGGGLSEDEGWLRHPSSLRGLMTYQTRKRRMSKVFRLET